MMRLKTLTALRRRGAAVKRLNRSQHRREPRSMLRSQAHAHRYFWLTGAAAWRQVEFIHRLRGEAA